MREFLEHLRNDKNKAENTIIAYERDIAAFEKYLKERGKSLGRANESDAVSYVLELGNQNKSKATINRKVSSLRNYYDFRIAGGAMTNNPFAKIKSVKGDRRQVDFLTIDEAARLMDLPEGDKKGMRDKALLEFMYGTGARVTEVVRLKFSDLNLNMNFVTLKDADEENRLVPLGRYAAEAMNNYVNDAYPEIVGRKPDPDDYVFVNFRGETLTRQGIWKILKDYGAIIGIADRMTPQILRDSFAVHILQRGGDLKTLQELMGFEDMSVGIAYLAVTDIHVRDVFKKTHPRA